MIFCSVVIGPPGDCQMMSELSQTRTPEPEPGTSEPEPPHPGTRTPNPRTPEPALHLSSAVHSLRHGELVRVIEIASNRHTHRDACRADTERFQELGKVQRCRFAFDGGIRGKDDLLDAAGGDAAE